MALAGAPAKSIEFPKNNELPSSDQLGKRSSRSPLVASLGTPPSADTVYMWNGFPGIWAANAMCFPSGDHWGLRLAVGGKLSWRRSVPSTLLHHRDPSG